MNAIPRRPGRAVALACALVSASAASASAASAATVAVDKACYITEDSAVGAPMSVSGTGFSPGETVKVSGGSVRAQAVADAAGNFTVTAEAPILNTSAPKAAVTTLAAVGETSGTSASVPVHSANFGVGVSSRSQPYKTRVLNVRRDKVTFEFAGFTPGKRIYAFYMHGRTTVRTSFGIANGPCGTLTRRALLYPGGRPRYDVYTVAFESVPRYSRTARPQSRASFNLVHF